VGVLGGGQLGRMLAIAAVRPPCLFPQLPSDTQPQAPLGVALQVLETAADCPASVAAGVTQGSFRDAAAVAAFAAGCDALTVEIEHVDAVRLGTSLPACTGSLAPQAALAAAEAAGVRCVPCAAAVALIQDKLAQKAHFQAAGVATAAFAGLRNQGDLDAAVARFGYPLLLKSRRLAYDGRGNATVRSPADIAAALAALGGFGCAPRLGWRRALTPAAATASGCTPRRGRRS